jgi:hypothetical protein
MRNRKKRSKDEKDERETMKKQDKKENREERRKKEDTVNKSGKMNSCGVHIFSICTAVNFVHSVSPTFC